MSLAKWGLVCRAGGVGLPCPCSFSEDVPSENVIFKMRGRKTPLSTSHFFEDVSGETLIFHAHRKFVSFSRSRFFEDVSGDIVIFKITRLKRQPPTSPFCEDVSRQMATLRNLTGQEREASLLSTRFVKYALLLVCRASVSWRACVCAWADQHATPARQTSTADQHGRPARQTSTTGQHGRPQKHSRPQQHGGPAWRISTADRMA